VEFNNFKAPGLII